MGGVGQGGGVLDSSTFSEGSSTTCRHGEWVLEPGCLGVSPGLAPFLAMSHWTSPPCTSFYHL